MLFESASICGVPRYFPLTGGTVIAIMVYVSGILSDRAFENLCVLCSVFYVNTARDVVTVLLIFAEYSFFYLHILPCTYRSTHTQAHMYTRGMVTTRNRSLVERGGKKAFVRVKIRPCTHKKKEGEKKMSEKKRYSRI